MHDQQIMTAGQVTLFTFGLRDNRKDPKYMFLTVWRFILGFLHSTIFLH